MSRRNVEISQGVLEGETVDTPLGSVRRFLGIPFGEMSEQMRFQAARPAPPWAGARRADKFGPSPIQQTDGPLVHMIPGAQLSDTSEDCLTLNVWSPAEPGEALPVLFWIYGGAFVIGGTAKPNYEASRLAAGQHVVVVSANYRVGLFGFADLREVGGEAIDAATNCGLRDLLLALRWVRDAISAFGGDPDRVTIFGESAGGSCVVNLLAAPDARSHFRGAISQSPGADLTQQPSVSAAAAALLLGELGLTSASDLLRLSSEQLLGAQLELGAKLTTSNSYTDEFGPVLFHPFIDGDIVPDTPVRSAAAGYGMDIDLIIGTTTDEMQLFRDPAVDSMSQEELVAWTSAYMRQRPALVNPTRDFAESVLAAYSKLLAAQARNSPSHLLTRIQTDGHMRLPTYGIADERSERGRTFAYEFAWAAQNPSKQLDSFHGIDLPFTFDNLGGVDGWAGFLGLDEGVDPVGRALRSAWAAFAKTGDPSCDEVGEWPEYGRDRRTMLIDDRPRVTGDPMAAVRSIWESESAVGSE